MRKRQKTFYADNLKEINFCGHKLFEFNGGVFELPYDIEPTKGDHTFENCDNCRKYRDNIIDSLKKEGDKFPYCCEWHTKLKGLKEFDFKDFKNEEINVVNKAFYCYHHSINNIENDDWFEEITNYYDYAIESLGSFPQGYGSPYLSSTFNAILKDRLNVQLENGNSTILSDKVLKERLEQLLRYLKQWFEPDKENDREYKSDNLTILLSIYEKWFKTFPFEIYYFQHLKEFYRKRIFILKGNKRYNPYTGMTSYTMHTRESLLKALSDITNNIISNINGLKLYEQGKLKDIENIKLQLVLKGRKLELEELLKTNNGKTDAYRKALKRWFKGEKKFLEEIKPYLENIPKNSIRTNQRPNRTDIAYYIYYLNETKSLTIKNTFPSEKAWKEIGELYNKNAKNIQKIYNEISVSKELRYKKSRIKNIEFVINEMLSENEKAQNLAKDELKLAKLKS